MRRSALLCLPLLAGLTLTACGDADGGAGTSGTADAEALEVVVSLFPYEFVVREVGGDDVAVTSLATPGVDPHDLELSPQQVGAVSEADLVVHSPGLQPALDEVVEQQVPDRALDVLGLVEVREEEGHSEEEGSAEGDTHGEEGHEHSGEDPHVWLDPDRLATIADGVAERLGEIDPERAEAFAERAAALRAELEQVDEEYREGLSDCERREVVTSHDAFGYLTGRYDLEQIPVSGIDGEQEPSPRRLAEVAEIARERGVTTIFFEQEVSPEVAEQLAREVGAEARVLTPLETAPPEGGYLDAVRDNLTALREALGCA